MKLKGHSRPSIAMSLIAAPVAIGFVIFGITKAISDFGLFGWLWTLVAISIAGYHLFNLFSKNGIAEGVYSLEQSTNSNSNSNSNSDTSGSVEERLKKLTDLKNRNIISESEYEKQRSNIINSI